MTELAWNELSKPCPLHWAGECDCYDSLIKRLCGTFVCDKAYRAMRTDGERAMRTDGERVNK